MRYFLFILLSLLSLAVVTPVSAATKIHTFDVPSPACVAAPCSTSQASVSSQNTGNVSALSRHVRAWKKQ